MADAFDRIGKTLPSILSADFIGTLTLKDVSLGSPNAATAKAQVAYLETAMHAATTGKIAGLVTAPISKTAAQSAGFAYPGHTEFLADRLNADRFAMMFAGPKLNVVLATVHEALRDVPTLLTSEKIQDTIALAARAMREDFGLAMPRIGVLALNPHAGEAGTFGDEEKTIIEPAIRLAQKNLGDSATVLGPLVPDAAFRMPLDCFVAMYHDQGLIPVKLIDFDDSVNVTLGLPIVRTSPDHGVAYDIASQNKARSTSMLAAIELAFRLVDQRAR